MPSSPRPQPQQDREICLSARHNSSRIAAVFFFSAIVPNHKADGDVGTVTTFTSSLVGLRVVHPGAVLRQMYSERSRLTAS
jgi:hypothetical protein